MKREVPFEWHSLTISRPVGMRISDALANFLRQYNIKVFKIVLVDKEEIQIVYKGYEYMKNEV